MLMASASTAVLKKNEITACSVTSRRSALLRMATSEVCEAAPIEDLLQKNQTVLVQVSKESLGTKGARITSFISLPGRYLVYMPQARHIGVSRRIRDDRERERLRAALRSVSLPPGGFILRTNAEGKSESEFAADVEFLTRLWAQVQARFEQVR